MAPDTLSNFLLKHDLTSNSIAMRYEDAEAGPAML
jgi:hypothetical protein